MSFWKHADSIKIAPSTLPCCTNSCSRQAARRKCNTQSAEEHKLATLASEQAIYTSAFRAKPFTHTHIDIMRQPISIASVSGAASNAGSLATSSKSTYTTCGDQTDRSSPGSDYAMSSDGSNTDIGERVRSMSSSSVEVTPTIARRAFSVTPPRSTSPNPHPRGSPTTSAKALSWHCRSCMRNPCHEPIATACGHIFCQTYVLLIQHYPSAC